MTARFCLSSPALLLAAVLIVSPAPCVVWGQYVPSGSTGRVSGVSDAQRGQWQPGPDGSMYYAEPMNRVDLRSATTARRVATGEPLQQISSTQVTPNHLEAGAYVRKLSPQPSAPTPPSVHFNAADGRQASAPAATTISESPSDLARTAAPSKTPALTAPPLLPTRNENDAVMDTARGLLAHTSNVSEPQVTSTWLPLPESNVVTPAQWTPPPSIPPIPPAPPLTSSGESSTLQSRQWQGVAPADTRPRLPAGGPGTLAPINPLPTAPSTAPNRLPFTTQAAPPCDSLTHAPAGFSPGIASSGYAPMTPISPTYTPAYAANPRYLSSYGAVPTPAVTAAPQLTARGDGMTLRRGMLGQPILHVQGQPLRNFLRFVTP